MTKIEPKNKIKSDYLISNKLSALPVDQKLHAISHSLLSLLGAAAGVTFILWIFDTFINTQTTEIHDESWYASVIIRFVSFIALLYFSFTATFASQPKNITKNNTAKPRYKQVLMRVFAAVCAALFFGDIASSTFADKSAGAEAIIQASLLMILVLAAVVSVACGRAVLRLWREAGKDADVPIWNEPTEMTVNKQMSYFSGQFFWIGAFLVSWFLSNNLRSFLPLDNKPLSTCLLASLENILIIFIASAYFIKRELILTRILKKGRHRNLDIFMSSAGILISLEILIRIVISYADLSASGFWIGTIVCSFGILSGCFSLIKTILKTPF